MSLGDIFRSFSDLGHGSFTREQGSFRWALTKDGCLHIQGSGVLAQDESIECHGNAGEGWDSHYDAETTYTDWPWYALVDKVTRLIIGPGITEIGEEAFRGYPNLGSLELGPDLEIIRERAFQDTPLTTVTLPEGLKRICNSAFRGTRLEHIDLPASLRRIEALAFSGTQLRDIAFPSGLEYLHSCALWDTPLCPELKYHYEATKRVYRNTQSIECYAGGWLILYLAVEPGPYQVHPGTRGIADDAVHNVTDLYVPASVALICGAPSSMYIPPASGTIWLHPDSAASPQVHYLYASRLRNVYPLIIRGEKDHIDQIWWHPTYYSHIHRVYQRARMSPEATLLLKKLEAGVVREVQRLSHEQQTRACDAFSPSEYSGQHGNHCIEGSISPSREGVATLRFTPWARDLPCFVTMSLLNHLEQYLQNHSVRGYPLTLTFETSGVLPLKPDLGLFRKIVAILYPGVKVK